MTNVTGVPAFGGGGFAFRQPPDPPEPAVPQVTGTALNGTATYTKGNELPGQNGTDITYPKSAETSRSKAVTVSDNGERAAIFGEKLPEDALVGPTPAFQASVLEVELDLRNALAEIAAKRTQSADEAAIAPAQTATANATPSTETVEKVSRDTQTALTAIPSEAQPPEARYASPAAVLQTPYDG
jgi:hypothetical protein